MSFLLVILKETLERKCSQVILILSRTEKCILGIATPIIRENP